MSFGLRNAPTSFMDLMNRVFQYYIDSFVIVFIYDILTYSKNENEYESHLRLALQVLTEHKFYSKCSKCEFCLRSVAFFVHIISKDSLEVDPKKIDVVRNRPTP